MSGLQTTLQCVTGASASAGQIIVIVLLSVLVALHVATTVYSIRAAKGAEESAANTRNANKFQLQSPIRAHQSQQERQEQEEKEEQEEQDPGACALACGEACTGSSGIPILKTCARHCAAMCGFHFV